MQWLTGAVGLLLAGLARLVTGAQGHWYGDPPKAEQRIYGDIRLRTASAAGSVFIVRLPL